MGLDAVVYKSRERFPVDPAGVGLRMEPDTREWYSDNGYLPDAIKVAGVEALHRRLGNVSSIAELHRDAARILSPGSLILSRVLYDGSHCGDFIGFERMTELKEEIELLRRSEPRTQLMASFLDDLDQLAAEAEEQRNPVVFV